MKSVLSRSSTGGQRRADSVAAKHSRPREIPQTKGFDSTLALLREGYLFISNRCQQYQSDLFETRLLLQKALCMRGQEAALIFYDPQRFERVGAMPDRIKQTLFGYGGVQGLDAEAHRHRKAMLMSLMAPEHIDELVYTMQHHWYVALETWQRHEEIVFFDELRPLLCRAVCEWSGVPLPASDVEKRTNQLVARIDSSGAIGPKQWHGRWARWRTEAWIKGLVEGVRKGKFDPPVGSALYVISHHRDLDGNLLDSHVAAVEVLNVLRPTVAVGRFITFAALALHEYPACRAQLQTSGDEYTEWFAQEVRRYYPFFPMVAACVRKDFTWEGYRFPQGRRVLLDLYGTNHDARRWEKPDQFWPKRFQDHQVSPFDLIPQGGGDYDINHRCAGEWITLALMKAALTLLTTEMSYTIPDQDLSVSLKAFPTLPKSRLRMRNLRRVVQRVKPEPVVSAAQPSDRTFIIDAADRSGGVDCQ